MPKIKQKIVFFIEQTDKSVTNPIFSGRASFIGNLYINRFAIDEDAGFEIRKVSEFSKNHKNPEY